MPVGDLDEGEPLVQAAGSDHAGFVNHEFRPGRQMRLSARLARRGIDMDAIPDPS